MQVNKAPFIKKLVNGKSERMAHAENRTECVCPETEMGNLPEKFKAVLFGLQRKFFRITQTQYLDMSGF